jgi:hypothetical protein
VEFVLPLRNLEVLPEGDVVVMLFKVRSIHDVEYPSLLGHYKMALGRTLILATLEMNILKLIAFD